MLEEDERASRPSSLLLEAPPPEREPLHFDVQLIGAPPEVEQLVNNIKQVAEDFLYHWKTFPIVLPPSRFSGPGNRLSDIIIPPPCDELDAAALDAGIEPEPLSPKQLQSIREKGEFEVPSRHFPGQTHVWRVSGWLQRGRARAREDLLRHVARAAALIAVTARDRLCSRQPLSLRAGLQGAAAGLYRLLDLLIGMPSMEARDLEKKIQEERSRYLVAELICEPEHEEEIAALAAWVQRALRRAAEKPEGRDVTRTLPRVPHRYTTPQRTKVDLTLYRREVMRRAAPVLQSILERASRGWFLHFRERTAAHLAAQHAPPRHLEEEVRAAAMREYVARVCAAVRASAELRDLAPAAPALLADQLRAAAARDRAEDAARARLRAGLAAAEARLRARHPLLARAPAWRAARLAAAERRLRHELRWAAREEAAAALLALDLPQQRYFLARDLTFARDREPLLAAELRAATVPTRVFVWRSRAVSTRWAGWRAAVCAARAHSWARRAARALAGGVACRSPLSLRTLLHRAPLRPERDAEDTWPPCRGEVPTMWSRLLKLWRHVSKERSRIDSEPDTGLLGAGVWRAVQRVLWLCLGVVGSAALVVLFPLCVVVTSALALLAAAAAPLWAPPLALVAHVSNALVYDADCPRPELNRWFPLFECVLWRVCVLGVLQPLAALALALALVPLTALALAGAAAWEGARGAWEAIAWRVVIVRSARVPRRDSPYCRRVAGPGLTAPGYYELTAAQAAAAAAAQAELDELLAWAEKTERDIQRPLQDYKQFVDACFGPFSVQIAKCGPYVSLERECGLLCGEVRAAAAARRRALSLPLGAGARARCRLSRAALRAARAAAAPELRRACSRAARSPDWWAARGLDPGDWHALVDHTLVEAFDAEVVVPLEAGAACVALGAGAGARAWESRARAPPDVVRGADGPRDDALRADAPRAEPPRVPPPALAPAAFNPRAHPHPPLPPPALVALLLYNRDSDNPIPLESEVCSELIRTLEEAGAGGVQRYRGGGDSGDEARHNCRSVEGVAGGEGRGACRWTLTGRGVRLRADLASPEDVTLDAERRGTSV